MSQLQLKLRRSPIGITERQQANLLGLGLTKNQKVVLRENSPAVRGMVKKVLHMIDVQEVEDAQ
jgi:large subunit ribosomal protein L30